MKLLLENWRKFLKENDYETTGEYDMTQDWEDSETSSTDPDDYSDDWEPGPDESNPITGEVGPRTQPQPTDYATSTRWAGMGREGEDVYESIPAEEATAELYSASYDLDPSGTGKHGAGAQAYIRRILDDRNLKIDTPEAAEEYYKDHIRDQLRGSAGVEHITQTPEGGAHPAGKPLPAPAYYDQATRKVYIDPQALAAYGEPYDDTLRHEEAHARDIGVNLYAGLPPEDQRRALQLPSGTDIEDVKQRSPGWHGQKVRMSRVQYEDMKELFPGMAHDPDARPGLVDLRPPTPFRDTRAAHGEQSHEIHAGLSYQRALINKAYQDGLRDSPDFTKEDIRALKMAGTTHTTGPGQTGGFRMKSGNRMPYAHQASDLYYALGNIANTELSDQEIADRLNRIAMAPTRQQQPSIPGKAGSVVVESMEKRTFDKWRKFLKEEKSA